MSKLIIPIILIGIAVVLFLTFTNPLYHDVGTLKTEAASYREALTNSKTLENERDKLTQKYNSIDPQNLEKLRKMLPDSVDNIRLILEIEKIATPYGMALRGVKYDTQKKENNLPEGVAPPPDMEMTNPDFGAWTLEFSTAGTYQNFLSFLKDLERNLRIVDISSISFSSDVGQEIPPPHIYKYDFKIKTYWLKN